ncbi:RNA-guided endonuclease InsQ/TnpB family protein [Lysinibacillus irui]|uniref:Transposase n=1 Tax=Lysinibacillus irui TaxID=2998077 RepID=A0AAJ5RR37_9BACI|nr:transposase [Lysinibacillus irui]WDV09390.1 transposase [Lysinibacillus irui]
MIKIVKTMKYEIKYDKELYNLLGDIQHAIWLIKNRATTAAYDWQQFSFSYNERFGEYPKEKEIIGKTLSPDVYGFLKAMGSFVSSSIVDSAVNEAITKFKNDKVKILKGEQSIQIYRRNGSFPIRVSQIKGITKLDNKTYNAKLSLLSKEGAKERNCKGQSVVTLITGNGAYEILDRIINGEYKMSDSRIYKRKNKFYLLLTYKFEKEAEKVLDENRIMGVDIGVAVPAVLAINEDKFYRQYVGDAKEVSDFVAQINDRKKRLQRSRKWAGEGSRGSGRKKLMKPVDAISNKIHNYRETKNHTWSRFIVNEALKNECGTIQIEDLSGITTDNAFLKDWTFYSLQQKIIDKAKEHGIKVVKVKPNYTSKRCNKCGFIHKDVKKEIWRPTQADFKCLNCGHETNADLNAARNIAIKDIEKIIEDQLKAQEKNVKHVEEYLV